MVNVAAAIFTSHLPMGLMIPEKYVTVLTCIHSPSILYQDRSLRHYELVTVEIFLSSTGLEIRAKNI